MTRPTMEQTLMLMAQVVAARGTCVRAQVGCLITNRDMTNVVSMGYNGNARGLPNTCDGPLPGGCGCIHAETNALLKAPFGPPLVMFTTTSPCLSCAKLILNSSVRWLYYLIRYRDPAGLELLANHGVEIFKL